MCKQTIALVHYHFAAKVLFRELSKLPIVGSLLRETVIHFQKKKTFYFYLPKKKVKINAKINVEIKRGNFDK